MIHVVGVADMATSSTPGVILVTYALGSCLGITVHDPVTKVGGLLHAMLPQSTANGGSEVENPNMFLDTGLPLLFRTLYEKGAEKSRLVVKTAGGAQTYGSTKNDVFQIGKRNAIMLKKMLWHNGVLLAASDLGGTTPRNLSLDISTGEVLLKINANESEL